MGRARVMLTLSLATTGFTVAGCGFQVTGGSNGGDARLADAIDLDAPALADAPLDGPLTMACPWPYVPPHVTPCPSVLPQPPSDLDLQMNGTYVLTTDPPMLRAPDMSVVTLQSTITDGARIVWTRVFRLGSGTTLRVTGPLPLVLVANLSISVDGTIDASSTVGALTAIGAGSQPGSCSTTTTSIPAGNGAPCSHGGSGGGGGGFGANGGNGGAGGVDHNCVQGNDGEGISGGAGGTADSGMTLRGGCDGGNGAVGNGNTTNPGPGGRGGGAIALVARDHVQINATAIVHVGGSGGRPATGGRSSGGGGGSGGMISLAGTTITLVSGAILAANGGGGGGGSNNGLATAGDDGKPASAVADGGPKEGDGGDGGDGGFASTAATRGSNVERGGGGGGGSVGRIRLRTAPGNQPQTAGAILSPPAS